ncbi:MAG: hypothetical protein LAO20_10100 [Acidobacteriia bacterium]|nr:hypothetical protein [Terriglobia bacterium]
MKRFSLDLPISVKYLDNTRSEVAGRTRDVSSRGIYMFVAAPMAQGAAIEFVMTLPSEITLTEPVRVHCRGRILRVEQTAPEQGAAVAQGVAVAIDKYDFVGDDV